MRPDTEKHISELEREVETNPKWNSSLSENFTSGAHQTRYKILMSKVNELEGTKILEVGAAPYTFTYLLEKENYNISGVDINPDHLRDVWKKYDFDIRQADVEVDALPVEPNSFDIAIFSEVLEHLYRDPIHPFEEINRVLHQDGKLILTTPNLHSLRNIALFIRGESFSDVYDVYSSIREQGHGGHIREYSKNEVTNILENTGFKIQKHEFRNMGWHGGKDDKQYFPLIKTALNNIKKLRRRQLIIASLSDNIN